MLAGSELTLTEFYREDNYFNQCHDKEIWIMIMKGCKQGEMSIIELCWN